MPNFQLINHYEYFFILFYGNILNQSLTTFIPHQDLIAPFYGDISTTDLRMGGQYRYTGTVGCQVAEVFQTSRCRLLFITHTYVVLRWKCFSSKYLNNIPAQMFLHKFVMLFMKLLPLNSVAVFINFNKVKSFNRTIISRYLAFSRLRFSVNLPSAFPSVSSTHRSKYALLIIYEINSNRKNNMTDLSELCPQSLLN